MRTFGPFHPVRADQHGELYRQHARTLQQLRQSHEELDHFVRVLSHDMTANFMLLESAFSRLKGLLGEPVRGELNGPVAHVEACLRESKRFLDDLVGLAKTGSVEMEPSSVDAARVVEEVLFEQQELLARRKVRVELRRPLPAVWCSEHRLKQVLTNLVRNALKHGCDRQSPQITISSAEHWTGRARSTCQRLAAIRVHDNGPGIDPHFHDEIFLPGRRLPQAAPDGSGMGLAIAKKIVEHYGGSIRVDAVCRDGTAMIFTLPVPPEEPAATALALGPECRTAAAERRIEHDAPHENQTLHRHQPASHAVNPLDQPWG